MRKLNQFMLGLNLGMLIITAGLGMHSSVLLHAFLAGVSVLAICLSPRVQ